MLFSSLHDILDRKPGALKDDAKEAENGNIRMQGSEFLSMETSLSRTNVCNARCICLCHNRLTTITSDSMNQILGTLFVGYAGLPIFPKSNCTETTCIRHSSVLLTISYYFPRWFAARMIAFQYSWTSLNKYRLNIKTPRTRSDSEHVFIYAMTGNISQVQAVFANSLASPFDMIQTSGHSLLHVRCSISQHTSLC